MFMGSLCTHCSAQVCQAGTTESRMLEFEIGILKRISHEYVISLKEVLETPKVRPVGVCV
jgi:hypothetical protein